MTPVVDMPALGERLLLWRRRAGLSQTALAARAGVDPMTISRIESGQKKRLELETAARLALGCGRTLDQLCGLEAPPAQALATNGQADAAETTPATGPQWSDEQLMARIVLWHEQEQVTIAGIAQRLNALHVPTRSGRGKWYQASVSEVLHHSRRRLPRAKKERQAWLAKYNPEHH
jgi:transcriptional regulator with XRE-family HTH domain